MSSFAICAMGEGAVGRGAGREPAPLLPIRTRTAYRRCSPVVLLAVIGLGGCASGSTYTIQSADARDANGRASLYCEKRASMAQLERVERHVEGDIDVFRCVSRRD